MKKNKFSRYFIFISFLTFLAIFGSIVQVGYNKLITPIVQIQSSSLMKPIDPNLDLQTLDLIEKKEELNLLPETVLPTISTSSGENE